MTEAEWEANTDPYHVLGAVRRTLPRDGACSIRTPERKLRLFAVALGRCLQSLFKHQWHQMALDATEEVADDAAMEDEVRRALYQLHQETKHPCHPDNPHLDQAIWSAAIPHEFWEATDGLMRSCAHALRTAWGDRVPPVPTQAALLRDIFGNPFRPVEFSPEWRTSTAVAIAQQMYESRDFSAMPILADALQDVGCDNEHILNHCRDSEGVHVRGCWVVDHVLGKA